MFDFGRKKSRFEFGELTAHDDGQIEAHRHQHERGGTLWHEGKLLLRDLFIAAMIAVLLTVFVVQPVKVEGSSMLPRLHDGERIFVNKMIYYQLPALERGDIVVFWYPKNPSVSYVKRLIALPGETVEMRGGQVFINDQLLNEPYLDPAHNYSKNTNYPRTEIPAHYYFVLGDNRDNSSDSREWEFVPEKYIYGTALFRFYPFDKIGVIRHEVEYNLPTRRQPANTYDEEP